MGLSCSSQDVQPGEYDKCGTEECPGIGKFTQNHQSEDHGRNDLSVGEGREDVRWRRGEGTDQKKLPRSIHET